MQSSKYTLPADGKQKATLNFSAYTNKAKKLETLSSTPEIFLNDKPYSKKEFTSTKPGIYTFYAKYEGLESNTIKIKVLPAKEYVYSVLKGLYLWADKVPEVDPTAYETPEALVAKLIYSKARGGPDRWTYIEGKTKHDVFYKKGQYLGYGFRMDYDSKEILRLSRVSVDSPASRAQLKRGMAIKKLNGKTIEEVDKQSLWSAFLGANKPGHPLTLSLETPEGKTLEVTLKKDWIVAKSVSKTKILETSQGKVGYVLFNQFIGTSKEELNQAFKGFKVNKIKELVLDLRYNGGGQLDVAEHLGALVAGSPHLKDIFFKYVHNEEYKHWNSSTRLEKTSEHALALKRVVVLTSRSTASASEVLIHSLRSYIKVQLIGGLTYGKPVGMYTLSFFDKVILPISFHITNHKGEGNYFDGLKPNLPVEDTILHALGSPDEPLLKKALEYLKTTYTFPKQKTYPQPIFQSRQFLDKSAKWNGLRRIIGMF